MRDGPTTSRAYTYVYMYRCTYIVYVQYVHVVVYVYTSRQTRVMLLVRCKEISVSSENKNMETVGIYYIGYFVVVAHGA